MLNIRLFRNRQGLTMKQLGAMVGVTESAISQYETGKRKPDYEMLLRLAEALDCSVPDLLYDYDSLASASGSSASVPSFELSPEEVQLIKDFRDASDDFREEAAGMLRRSAERNRRDAQSSRSSA